MRISIPIALMVCLLISENASATVYTYTISGTVDDGQSYGFGDLSGTTFVATYIVNDALKSAVYAYDSSGSSAQGGGNSWRVRPLH